MKLIIFILIVLIIAALLIRIILRSVNQHSPLLMQLHAAGIRTGDAERILSSGRGYRPAEREYPATITPVVAVIQDGVSVAC